MKTKKIALFTSVGLVGKKIAEEALSRGHKVKVIVPDRNEFHIKHPNLSVVSGDVNINEEVSKHAKGNDLVIFVNELKKHSQGECFNATRSILMGIKRAGIKFLVVSGYGLHFASDVKQEEKEAWNIIEEEHLAAIKLIKKEPEISWRYFYVTAEEPESGNHLPVKNTNFILNMPSVGGDISIEKYASTIMEEVEKVGSSYPEKYKEPSILSNSFHNNKIYNNLN